MSRTRSMLLLTVAAVSLGACKKKAPEVAPTPTPTPVTRDDEAAERARREAAEKARREAEEKARKEAEARLAGARAALEATIYFDYDKSDLTDEAVAALDGKVPVLQANAAVKIRIEGHTDNRGSDEYNLALGQRRAASVKRWFADRGIEERRIEIVSFGRERPAVTGEDEAARSKNRRAEFEILAGGEALAGPR